MCFSEFRSDPGSSWAEWGVVGGGSFPFFHLFINEFLISYPWSALDPFVPPPTMSVYRPHVIPARPRKSFLEQLLMWAIGPITQQWCRAPSDKMLNGWREEGCGGGGGRTGGGQQQVAVGTTCALLSSSRLQRWGVIFNGDGCENC